MCEVCTDNRFEVIAAYKKMLTERTNIKTSPDEMAVIDNVLFRFWQFGWLPPVPHGRLIDADALESRLSDLLMFPSNLVNGQWIINTIREIPTVIPADEEENNDL